MLCDFVDLSYPYQFQMAASLSAFHHVQSHDVFYFMNQNDNKLHPFLHKLFLFGELAGSQLVRLEAIFGEAPIGGVAPRFVVFRQNVKAVC